MELGLYPVRFDEISLEENIHLTAQAGFTFLCARDPAEVENEVFHTCAEKERLWIDNVHLTGAKTNYMWFPGETGDIVMNRFCDEITRCANRGVKTGIIHVTWGWELDPKVSDIGLDRFRRIVEHAEKERFTVTFENSVFPDILFAVLDATKGSPASRHCLDTGHWNAFAPTLDLPHMLADRLSATHVQDNDGKNDLHLIPFDGCTPFADIADVLGKMDHLCFEVARRTHHPEWPGMTAEQIAEELKRCPVIHDPRLCRIEDGRWWCYEDLTPEEYLAHLMDAGKKLLALPGIR